MTMPPALKPDPKLDLVLERTLDVPRELVWTAWTTPAHIRQWFVPRPWTITDCEIDLRPGGVFRFVMLSGNPAEPAARLDRCPPARLPAFGKSVLHGDPEP
jgi:uncharacterized protein YndB with AHSA1/START domain